MERYKNKIESKSSLLGGAQDIEIPGLLNSKQWHSVLTSTGGKYGKK